MDSFPAGVDEKLHYYIYRLIDPRNGETFYVGKGKGNRVFQHVNATKASDVPAIADTDSAEEQALDDDGSLKVRRITIFGARGFRSSMSSTATESKIPKQLTKSKPH